MFAAALHYKCIFVVVVWLCVNNSATCRWVVFVFSMRFLCTSIASSNELRVDCAVAASCGAAEAGVFVFMSVSRCLCIRVCVRGALLLLLRTAPALLSLSLPFCSASFSLRCLHHKNRILIAFQFVIVYHTHTGREGVIEIATLQYVCLCVTIFR